MKKCIECGQPHDRLTKTCRICIDRSNARQKKRYQERRAQGLCPRCGEQPMENSKHCAKCKARVTDKSRKVRSRRFKDNKCVYCGQNLPENGRRTCSECLSKLGNLYKTRKDRLNKMGLCVRCGRFPQLSGFSRWGNHHSVCQACYLRHVSQCNLGTQKHDTVLLEKLEAQNYRCPYTGEHLIIGGNAWIDHIMPRSRFPELAKDIDNVEWVTETVNRMKQNQTPDEFLTLIKQIYDYRLL